MCAKSSKTRRFHALYDRIHRSDVVWEAWKRVRGNKGAAGVDEITLRSIEERGVTRFLEGIQADLKAGRYRPSPVKRRWIPKADGKQRPLGIPTVRDRVIQMAAKLVIEPIFEADFQPCSYGFRPKRSATQALEAIREAGNRGHSFVVDADIQGYFDGIDRSMLMELVKERISDRRIWKLIRQWLEAGVMEDGTVRQAGSDLGGTLCVARGAGSVCRRLCATSAEGRGGPNVCNCFTDEGRPPGTGLQEQVSNHLWRLWAKAMVVSADGKGLERTRSGDWQEEDCKGTTDDVSKA